MPNKKKKTRSDVAINFISGWLGREENKSKVGDIVRGKNARQKEYDKYK